MFIVLKQTCPPIRIYQDRAKKQSHSQLYVMLQLVQMPGLLVRKPCSKSFLTTYPQPSQHRTSLTFLRTVVYKTPHSGSTLRYTKKYISFKNRLRHLKPHKSSCSLNITLNRVAPHMCFEMRHRLEQKLQTHHYVWRSVTARKWLLQILRPTHLGGVGHVCIYIYIYMYIYIYTCMYLRI